MYPISNDGGTAGATAGAGWTSVVSAVSNGLVRGARVTNEGAAPGWFTFDGGTSPIRLPPPGASDSIDFQKLLGAPLSLAGGVKIKRDGATDLSGIWFELF